MSDFGEAIIQRINNPELNKTTNPMNRIIHYAIGEWLQHFDEKEFFEQFFLQDATGKYLDLHGKDFGILRKLNENDEDYRSRIINESIGHLTVTFLKTVYGVEVYSKVDNFNASNNYLTSDNPYFAKNGFMGIADATTKNILNKKFVLDNGVTWL